MVGGEKSVRSVVGAPDHQQLPPRCQTSSAPAPAPVPVPTSHSISSSDLQHSGNNQVKCSDSNIKCGDNEKCCCPDGQCTCSRTDALRGSVDKTAPADTENITRKFQQTSLDSFVSEDDTVEATDSAFEEESSEYWGMSPGLTRQNSYLESVPENGSLSRRSSLLDEDVKETLSRRTSRESRGPLSRRGSSLDDLEPRGGDGKEPLGRRDSLLEAVLAAKKSGWKGLVRTDSMESGASLASSMASVSSMSSEGSSCPCDDCFLGITDLLQASLSQPSRPKKVKFHMWCN